MFSLFRSKPEANVFSVFSREQYSEARKVCVETILHTDNAKHQEMVHDLQVLYHSNSDAFYAPGRNFPTPAEIGVFQTVAHRRLAMAALLHGADISNACKPWNICQSWATRVLEEFFAQGDRERQEGIPIQMLNDREKVNKPSSQVAFIE